MIKREILVKIVQAMGREVINRAEDIVGEYDMITDLDVWLRFPINELPTMEVNRSHASKEVFKAYNEMKGEQE